MGGPLLRLRLPRAENLSSSLQLVDVHAADHQRQLRMHSGAAASCAPTCWCVANYYTRFVCVRVEGTNQTPASGATHPEYCQVAHCSAAVPRVNIICLGQYAEIWFANDADDTLWRVALLSRR